MNTLRDIIEFDGSRPLLALDVDGPLNRFDGDAKALGPTTRLVRTAHGAKYQIDFYPERIAELDRIITTYGVELGWLTAWGPNVRALVEQAFDGQLAGGFILKKQPPRYRGARHEDWKFTGLRARTRSSREILAAVGSRAFWWHVELADAEDTAREGGRRIAEDVFGADLGRGGGWVFSAELL